jgi:hypothetical protein
VVNRAAVASNRAAVTNNRAAVANNRAAVANDRAAVANDRAAVAMSGRLYALPHSQPCDNTFRNILNLVTSRSHKGVSWSEQKECAIIEQLHLCDIVRVGSGSVGMTTFGSK